jgi:hypothetical protein
MQIIESSLFRSRKCEYGNFELNPDKGWKISQTFIDYESKLLVVSVSCEDKSKWTDNGYNGWSIPTKEFKIDLGTLKILEFEDWKKYFNYDKKELISDDKKYKLVTQRVFEPKRNSDSIKEELYEIATDKLISSSESIAFRQEKGDDLLENLYCSIRKREEQKKILDAKPDLNDFYLKKLGMLKDKEVIIGYTDKSSAYKLVFSSNRFTLLTCDKIPTEYGAWETMEFVETKVYSDIEEYWEDFIKNEKWFVKFRIHLRISESRLVLAKHITSYFNNLRREYKFTYDEYNQINDWQNSVWSDEYKETELKQWCANCYKEVYYQGRYPKYICGECASKEVLDKEGNLLDFSNLGLSGGFKITRKNRDGQIILEDDTKQFCNCIIDGKEFFAQEARFGGIVIQRKEY